MFRPFSRLTADLGEKMSTVKEGLQTFGAQRVVAAIMPIALVTVPYAADTAKPVQAVSQLTWKTELVLADTTPSLLMTQDSEPRISVGPSRYDVEQQAIARQKAQEAAAAAAATKAKAEAEARAAQTAAAQAAAAQKPIITDASYDQKVAAAQKAAAAYGVDPAVLMAVWQTESGMRWYSSVTNPSGARGPMQFMWGTWREYAPSANADIDSAPDALLAAAKMLAANGGARGNYSQALFSYNHATWYVQKVLALAAQYR